MENLVTFYKGKKVFVTGHSGFKGTWLCKILTLLGAEVYGYSLPLEEGGMKDFYDVAGVDAQIQSTWGDIRDKSLLTNVMKEFSPELVIHLAAQPLVLDSYENPHYTYETNVMGTVNVLEAVRETYSVKSFLNVTTDKVYENKEWPWGYRENEPLNGHDPYSNSKSCSELVTQSYAKSFFHESKVGISTARAGNVIGGGDFAPNRIIPDCIRAAYDNQAIELRHPNSTRPYQHVLEPLFVYLQIMMESYLDYSKAGYFNVGPDECDCVTNGELVSLFCQLWGEGMEWRSVATMTPHEANLLKLDCSKIKGAFKWKPRWHIEEAVEKTVEWAKAYRNSEAIPTVMENQIRCFIENEK